MAYDSLRGVTLLFGGYTGWTEVAGIIDLIYNGETWEWNGVTWTQRAVIGPSPRGFHAMTYDSDRGVVVLFGGDDNISGALHDTWEWNGSAWTRRTPPNVFSTRYSPTLAFDSARGVTVLAGDDGLGSQIHTAVWNGTIWNVRTYSGPDTRAYHAMAYDAIRGICVLFGGYVAYPNIQTPPFILGDTWEWNGTAWAQRVVAGPSPRAQLRMAYDASRGVTVMFGGVSVNGALGDTWEWDGTAWVQRMISGPSPRGASALVYDGGRGAIVLFGGSTWGVNGETWVLGPCPADFNGGGLSVSDIFDFLNAWFMGDPRADFNHANGVTPQDILDFIAAWFAGC